MKKNNRTVNKVPMIVNIILLLLLSCGFTSCLKNGNYNVDFSTVAPSIDFPLVASNGGPELVYAFTPPVTTFDFPLYVNLASPSTLKVPVTATLVIDTAYLTKYNADNGKNYQVMPSSYYTIHNGLNRTIAAGQRLDSMYITFNLSTFDLSQSWALPVTIGSASVPIEQWSHAIISPQVKNHLDGDYMLTGNSPMVDAASATLTGAYPNEVYLITAGPNSVYMYDVTVGGPAHLIMSGSSLSYYGSFSPIFTFDQNTGNITSVTNYYGQPAGNTRSGQLDPSGINHFNLSTLNGDVSYFMLQPSVITVAPYIRTSFNEHFKYLGPRP
ncbi:MAG TPA: DUF1735 domain-containing protein [Chitinophagaceae bacterium]|nr:DUF1735 domain-containing protein [Chitinophagaceae bacterium]